MLKVITFLSASLGIIAAVATLVKFVIRENGRYKILFLILVVLLTSTSVVLWNKVEIENEQELLAEIMRKDAKSVSSSIAVYGWEETGDYIGYLTQITSFYSRNIDYFPTEYEAYKKQLDNWIEYLKKEREQGNIIPGYSNDLTELKGLVSSGDSHLTQLAKMTKP